MPSIGRMLGSLMGLPADDRTAEQEIERLTLVEDGHIIGCVDMSAAELALPTHQLPTEGLYVCALAVLPLARRCGVGRALMEFSESFAREQGDGEVRDLWLHVERAAKGTVLLYEELGYKSMPDSKREYVEFTKALNLNQENNGIPDNLLMRKSIIT
uniref:N-acetyltransferase domain-containing protein n=1 Tax=Octactis speculum TaxID=3111310 RepID=A0A7S2DHC1_9STRA|mmetsp:Transcript_47983/g.65336  ORF Transcript_47983/g.65336 Transcript_47983/m.65336 type:complete len:157 (+) Transcript_47983:146-616(+)